MMPSRSAVQCAVYWGIATPLLSFITLGLGLGLGVALLTRMAYPFVPSITGAARGFTGSGERRSSDDTE
jgi:hypothetical protein